MNTTIIDINGSCEHKKIIKTVYLARRESYFMPAEYLAQGECWECGEIFELNYESLPEGAEIVEEIER